MVGTYGSLMTTSECYNDEKDDMGERHLCKVCSLMVKNKVQGEPEFILSPENCASIDLLLTFVIAQEEQSKARASCTVRCEGRGETSVRLPAAGHSTVIV